MSIFRYTLCLTAMFMAIACSAQETTKPVKFTKPQPVAAQKPAANYDAPDEAWRSVDPENLLLLDTDHGRIGVELYPEMAPKHVERIKSLARQKFYNGILFHRVIDGFMNQTGDPEGTGRGGSSLPDLTQEFKFRRDVDAVKVELFESGEELIGFMKSMPISTQPDEQADLTADFMVEAHGLHCPSVASMARANDVNSANSQFFLMRGTADFLDEQYTIWGVTVMGSDILTKIAVGEVSSNNGFKPDTLNKAQIAADLPTNYRPKVQVLKTSGPHFETFLNSLDKGDGTFPELCDIKIPTRVVK